MKVRDPNEPSYTPVFVVFAVAAAMGAMTIASSIRVHSLGPVPVFVSFAMCLLAMLNLQDLEGFSTMFLNYDLLARRWVPYAYAYPFIELGAGLLLIANLLP